MYTVYICVESIGGKRVAGMFFTVFDFLKSLVLCIFVSSIFSPREAGGVRHPSLLFSALVPASFWPGRFDLDF